MTTNIQDKENTLGILWLFKERYGFKQLPSDLAYEAYLKALMICANGDGTLADEERDWIIGYGCAYDCNPAIIEQLKVYKADEDIETVISGDFAASDSRYFLIYDAIQACCADGEYSEKERAVVLKGAKKLGISEDEFQKIEEIYLETVQLHKKRLAVLFPNGAPL
ncbi:hypothetical protein I8748_03865 [Nostoc sp. CENA67]|uniref:Co-chaperone DjlA N-terminal domain-containing protein n=1 Tax=Amazonocrinis nigriterrae CENA67 TaxID=2794033 RepID=A0A8J7HPX9_9NOST|nr:hypothetical protein [Amazonocrinis nigriterrae]MBH8561320.1 hypothetical protein [Amazonocrinis nigriterrae CENA67]